MWNIQGIYEERAVENFDIEARQYMTDLRALEETHIRESTMTMNLGEHVLFLFHER